MSWTDKASIEHIKKIRDIFKVKTFVETGTHVGINVLTHLDNFDTVFSCEKDKKYFEIANNKINDYFFYPNLHLHNNQLKFSSILR